MTFMALRDTATAEAGQEPNHLEVMNMSISSLSDTTNETLNAYGRTAVCLIGVYRAGGHAALKRISEGWEKLVKRGASRLSDNQQEHLVAAQRELAGFYDNGLSAVSDQSTRAVTSFVKVATDGVERLSGRVEKTESNFVRMPLDGAILLARPFVEAGRDVASLVAERAEKVASRIEKGDLKVVLPQAIEETVTKAAKAAKATPARRKTASSN